MKPLSVLVVALLTCLSAASVAFADDRPQGAPPADARTMSFADGAIKATADLDAAVGRLTFRLVSPNVSLDGAPVLVLTTDGGPRELTLVAAAGEPGTWIVTDDALKAARLVATLRIVVAGRPHTAALPTPSPVVPAPLAHGGRRLELAACTAEVEAAIDPTTGTVTLYVPDGHVATEVLLLIPDPKGTQTVALAKVEGRSGVWEGRHAALSTGVTGLRMRVTIDGKACDADLPTEERPQAPAASRRVKVDGGPTFEMTRGPKTGQYTFHAVEETFEGVSYVVEGPTLTVDGRVYTLVPVEGETRTWRLADLEPKSIDARDVQLSFSIKGKSFVVRFDLAGPAPK